MPPINASVTNQQITASVGETQIDVAVSGGVGPTGTAGAAATVAVGTVTTGAPGSSASVVNAGSSSAAVLNFTIPAGAAGAAGAQGIQGEAGPAGAAGQAATVAVGTVTTGAAGSSASVTNVGSSSAAVFNFTIPSGAAGAAGATGPQGPAGPAGTTSWNGITDKPATFAPSTHTHTASAITDFSTAAASAAPVQSVAGKVGSVLLSSSDIAFDSSVTIGGNLYVENSDISTDGTVSCYAVDFNASDVPVRAYADDALLIEVGGASRMQVGLSNVQFFAPILFPDPAVAASTRTNLGLATVSSSGSYNDLTNKPSIPSAYTLPTASSTVTGGVRIGSGVSIDANGVISVSTAYAATSHTHGNLTNDGKIGTASGQIVVTGTGGVVTTAATISASSVSGLPTAGTGASNYCAGNDARLSDARTPLSHTHSASDLTSGTLDAARLPTTAVTAGSYGSASSVGTFTVDSAGRLTAAGSTSIALAGSAITSGTVALARLPVTVEQSSAVGNSGTSTTLSLSSASVQTVTLSGNCTFTMPTATAGASLTLILTQGGSNTAAFTGVKWPAGTAPTITTGANKVDVLTFVSDGTSWYGVAVQNLA